MPFPKQLLAEHEDLIFDLKPHWIALLPSAAWALVAVGFFIVGSRLVADRSFEGGAQAALAIVAIGILLFLALGRFLRWYFTFFVLTTDRLITRHGIIAKRSKEIPLERINDVTFEQSVLERLIGAGDLILESAGERGQNVIGDVRNPEQVQLKIYKEIETNNDRMMSGGRTRDASIPEQIEALARLKEQGVLSDTEFDAKKRELLDRL